MRRPGQPAGRPAQEVRRLPCRALLLLRLPGGRCCSFRARPAAALGQRCSCGALLLCCMAAPACRALQLPRLTHKLTKRWLPLAVCAPALQKREWKALGHRESCAGRQGEGRLGCGEEECARRWRANAGSSHLRISYGFQG